MDVGAAIYKTYPAIPWKGINAENILCHSMGWLEGGGVEDYAVPMVCRSYGMLKVRSAVKIECRIKVSCIYSMQ